MQKFTLSVFFLILFSCGLLAQETNWCGTDELYREAVEQNPELIQIANDYRKELTNIIKYGTTKDDDDEILIVPVVFHILHEYGSENISDAQIYDAINILNRDNFKLNPDTSAIIPEFKDIASASNIEFRLATKAPDGSCTNGINRIPTVMTHDGYDPMAKFEQWSRGNYLNIWVARNMKDGVAGFAYYPSATVDPVMRRLDGIMVRHNYVGSIGTSNPSRERTLTHEVGHYLNLPHVWGSTNDPGVECGDDGIEDTPITKGWDYCPLRVFSAVCNPEIYENYQNYMDYSYCSNMFTAGQVDVMRAALRSSVAQRNNLIQTLTHIETGVLEETECTPKVDFYAEKNTRTACVGQSITFYPNIAKATAETYSWSFPGANIESSNSEMPTVTYSTPGWKTVTLTAGNSTGSGTKTKEQAIFVYGESITTSQFSESFSSESSINNKWIVAHTNENKMSYGVNWKWSSVGALDPGSMKLNIFSNPTPENYAIISPKINLEGKQGQYISFKYAFATQKYDPNEVNLKFEVLSSTNCGKTTKLQYKLEAPGDLLTGGNFADIEFTPTPQLWRTAIFQIDNALAVDNVQLIFKVRSDFGENNFYIDNINIGEWIVSTDDEDVVHNLKLYPNPTTNGASLEFTTNQSSVISVAVYDLTGKQVKAFTPKNYAPGLHNLEIETTDLAPGAYIVEMKGDVFNKSLKLIVTE